MKLITAIAASVALSGTALAQAPSSTPPSTTPPAASAPAASQPAKPVEKTDKFASIDADASGALTLAEIKLVDVAVTQADFDKYDADKSKSISKAEFGKWQASAKAAKPSSDAG